MAFLISTQPTETETFKKGMTLNNLYAYLQISWK